jgi:hypothetical protein
VGEDRGVQDEDEGLCGLTPPAVGELEQKSPDVEPTLTEGTSASSVIASAVV